MTDGFRAEVRDWLAEHVPATPLPSLDTGEGFEAHRAWERSLAAARLAVVTWPARYGGRDASLAEWLVFEEEYYAAGAPARVGQNGFFMLAPTLLAFGSPEQRDRLLSRMAAADDIWAQAWSEPDAGSDLAALRSRGVQVSGGWLVSGTKTWCSRAAFADRAFGLFRTDPALASSGRHRGLSYLLFGLRAPGVTVRPIRQLGGRTGFAEIFLDEVFVPDSDVVGEPGDGWRIARSTASHERGLSLRSSGRFLAAGADVPDAARRWASGDLTPGLVVWRRLADLGVTALAVPEKQGGLGASPLDLVVACAELGHHAVPGPVAESLAAGPVLLGALADAGPASCGEWLAGLAAGDLIATLAAPPQVPFAACADAAGLVLRAEDGVVDRGRPDATFRSVDPTRSLAEVHRGPVLADGVAGAVARALDFGALACSAQLLGAGQALLEASVRHAGLRVQFGRPVGAFQAVKHRLADVAIGLEFARPLLEAAGMALATGEPTAGRDVSAVKVACADAAYRAARAALQVHGAIGYTAEHDLSRFLLQVRALVPAWGSQAEHRARVLREL